MAYPEVIIPPSVRPVSGFEPVLLDEQTVPFSPRFGRGTTQRQVWGDPIWTWRVRFEAMRSWERAQLYRAIRGVRGKAANVRMAPGLQIRGSFPATELLPNNDFSSGATSPWVVSGGTLSVSDGVMRVKFSGAGSEADVYNSSGLSVTQYAPYALRTFISGGSWDAAATIGPAFSDGTAQVDNYSTTRGLLTVAQVVRAATTSNVFAGVGLRGANLAGAYYEVSWSSFARCILADAGPNLFERASEFDNAYWTKSDCTITANAVAAPDGASTGDDLIENTANAQHHVLRALTVSSAAADYALCVAIRAGNRSFAWLEILEGTGSTSILQYFNLATGAVGASGATGAQWSGRRAFTVALGNSWTLCCLIGRKTNAATSLTCYAGSATADGTRTFVGSGLQAISLWRATAAQSSVPVRLTQTVASALASGTAQSGSALYVKGLPASTAGLLLTGDYIEVNGELKQLTASLDSDAAGLGYLQFTPGLWNSVADNEPIIVLNPMGRFYFAEDPRVLERLGVYTDFDLALLECTA